MKKLLLFSISFFAINAQAQFWTEKATGFTTASRGINAISIADANNIWVVAYDGSGGGVTNVRDFSKSTDGGNTWTPGVVTGLGIGTGTSIGSISAVSGTTAWASSNPSTSGGNNGIWKTENGGTNWIKQTTAAFNSAASFSNLVYFWDANNGVCQGDPASDGYFEIYTTTNGGTNWTRVPSANIPLPLNGDEYGYTNNYKVSGNTIWFGTSSGRLFKSTNKGLTWTASQTPLTDFGGPVTGDYSFSDANKGLLTLSTGELYNTTDGGTTWNPVSFTGTLYQAGLSYIPGTSKVVSTGISATSVSGTGSSYSYNDGLTWTNIDAAQHGEVAFLNETVGFTSGFNASATVGGIFKYTGTQLKVNSVANKQITAFPNPTNGNLHLTGATINEVVIFDLLGKQVYNGKFNSLTDVNLDLTSLQTGAYMLRATSDIGLTQTVKIMKN